MRCLRRNMQPFYYTVYLGRKAKTDADGRPIGVHSQLHSSPLSAHGNISPASGFASREAYGTATAYDCTIICASLPDGLNENSRVWIGAMPDKPHTHIVTGVSQALNSAAIHVRRVHVNG